MSHCVPRRDVDVWALYPCSQRLFGVPGLLSRRVHLHCLRRLAADCLFQVHRVCRGVFRKYLMFSYCRQCVCRVSERKSQFFFLHRHLQRNCIALSVAVQSHDQFVKYRNVRVCTGTLLLIGT